MLPCWGFRYKDGVYGPCSRAYKIYPERHSKPSSPASPPSSLTHNFLSDGHSCSILHILTHLFFRATFGIDNNIRFFFFFFWWGNKGSRKLRNIKSEFQYCAEVVWIIMWWLKWCLKAAIGINRKRRLRFLFLHISSLCL